MRITYMQNYKRGTDVVIYKTEVGKNLWLPGDGRKDKLGDLDSQHYCIYKNKNLL